MHLGSKAMPNPKQVGTEAAAGLLWEGYAECSPSYASSLVLACAPFQPVSIVVLAYRFPTSIPPPNPRCGERIASFRNGQFLARPFCLLS